MKLRMVDYGVIAAIILILYFLFHSKGLAVTDACLVGAPVVSGGCGNSISSNRQLTTTNPGNPKLCGVAKSVVDSGLRISYCIDPDSGQIYNINALDNPNIPVYFLSDPVLIADSEDFNNVPTQNRQVIS